LAPHGRKEAAVDLLDGLFAALALSMALLLVLAASRLSPRAALLTALGLAAWLGLTALLATSGALSVWSARPPRVPLLPLTALLAAGLFSRTRAASRLLDSIPPAWPLWTQSFRIAVEGLLFALLAAGRAPVQMTFEGQNLDALVGLTAPLLALWVSRGKAPKALVAAWNVLGALVLANTVRVAVTSFPGPLHRDWPGGTFTAPASFPWVWLPAFLVPLALSLHAFSLRQALRGGRDASE
jgi:hypothetical protein